MIRNLLIAAASSPNQAQRNQSLEILGNEYILKQGPFINEIFNLLCSQDRTDHVLSYSFLKKVIKESDRSKLSDLNQHMQKAFCFWYEKQRNRNSFNEIFSFQRENIIQLNALYLSLNTSARYRESFIDAIPFKICQLYTKRNQHQLYMYLSYYGQVLRQLDRYRIGNINSKRAAMGSVMLLKVTTKLNPESSMQASLWVDFSVNFSKFNSWIPDKGFLIKCLIQYSITRDSLMTLLEYLSTNFKIVWIIEDYCKILQGIQRIMYDCEINIKQYRCKEVETILKCLRSFLYSFFTCNTKVQNTGDAIISQYIYSYEQFQKTSLFLMNMIEYFSSNNEHQSMGNLSQMIVEYSTQILRLYLTYLDEEVVQKYAHAFMQNFSNDKNYGKLFIFFSSLPKTVLQIFQYNQFVMDMLGGNMQLSQSYEPVYVNFLTYFISLNDYIEMEVANKLAGFFNNLIQSRSNELMKFGNSHEEVPIQVTKTIERVSLSIYGLSKMYKYKDFVDQNPDYFRTVVQTIFDIMFKSANDLSLLVDSINELIQSKRPEWNQVIFQKALNYLIMLQNQKMKGQQIILYQIQIELYRIIRKTISFQQSFGNIQTLWINKTQTLNLTIDSCSDLKNLTIVCNLDQKSQAVREEIIFLLEEILLQLNQISHQGVFEPIKCLLVEFSEMIIDKILFEQLFVILQDTTQNSTQNIVQNNYFDKIQIASQQYAIVGAGYSRELHLTCIKIMLELSLYQKFLEMVFVIVRQLNSKYVLCLWEAIEILYPGKIDPSLMPENVRQRLEKIKTGNLLDLFQKMDLNEQNFKIKQTPSWYQLYRNILREDSIVIEIIHQRFKQFVES